MKSTLSWLKAHLDTAASLTEITDRLTMLGLELEGVEDRAAAFEQLHRRGFGYARPGHALEAVVARVEALGRQPLRPYAVAIAV